jgi:IS5 family transposase
MDAKLRECRIIPQRLSQSGHVGKIDTARMMEHETGMQLNVSAREYAAKKYVAGRDRFLLEIEASMPCSVSVAVMLPFYPKGEGCGRLPIGVERMLCQ